MLLHPSLSQCLRCVTPIPREAYAGEGRCPQCGNSRFTYLFPAYFRGLEAQPAAPLRSAEDASCFYHPTKLAAVPCDQCGRFLCTLCQVPWGSKTVCPNCLTAAKQGKKAQPPALEVQRTLYDTLALILATLPFLFLIYPALLGAPASLYLGIRYFNRQSSLVPRAPWRQSLAILLSLSEIALFVVGVYLVLRRNG